MARSRDEKSRTKVSVSGAALAVFRAIACTTASRFFDRCVSSRITTLRLCSWRRRSVRSTAVPITPSMSPDSPVFGVDPQRIEPMRAPDLQVELRRLALSALDHAPLQRREPAEVALAEHLGVGPAEEVLGLGPGRRVVHEGVAQPGILLEHRDRRILERQVEAPVGGRGLRGHRRQPHVEQPALGDVDRGPEQPVDRPVGVPASGRTSGRSDGRRRPGARRRRPPSGSRPVARTSRFRATAPGGSVPGIGSPAAAAVRPGRGLCSHA